jgi:thiol-disulfide isomerase/thioredoxin
MKMFIVKVPDHSSKRFYSLAQNFYLCEQFAVMRNLTLLAVLFVSTLSLFAQTESNLVWQTDLVKAHELSQATKKPIFAFFTGSDWCGWCKKLQKDVYAKPEFVAWAEKNVILLELDFPRSKQLPQELAQQNNSLQQFFKVTGFPTVWIFLTEFDGANKRFSINALGSLGYPQAELGKEEVKFLQDANSILAKNGTN